MNVIYLFHSSEYKLFMKSSFFIEKVASCGTRYMYTVSVKNSKPGKRVPVHTCERKQPDSSTVPL